MKTRIINLLKKNGINVATLTISENATQIVEIVRNWGAPKMMDICNALGNAGYNGRVCSTTVVRVVR